MLLLTLLPLATWAAELVGLTQIGGSNVYVVGTALPTNATTFYDVNLNLVSEITEAGWYYGKVGDDFVPFQAWKRVAFGVIDSEETFNASVTTEGEVLNVYYAKAIEKAEASFDGEGTHTYCNGTAEAWAKERDNWWWAASSQFPTFGTVSTGNRFPWVTIKATEETPCRVTFVYQAAPSTDVRVVTPWLTTLFSTTAENASRSGFASVNEELGLGQIFTRLAGGNENGSELTSDYTLDVNDEILVNNSGCTFVEDNLAVYWTPGVTEPPILSGVFYELQVTPQSGVVFPYQSDFDLSDPSINPDRVITLENTVVDYDVNLVAGLKAAVIKKLKINAIDGNPNPEAWKSFAPGSYTYSLGLINDDDKMVIVNGVNYIIAPVSYTELTIGSAKNEFAKDDDGNPILPVLTTGLTYNGAAQNLIATDGEAALGTKIEYAVVPEADYSPNGLAADYNGWDDKAEATDAGKYYVYARAAAAEVGSDDEGLWTAGDPELLSVAAVDEAVRPDNFTTIAKATPTIVWEDKSSVAAVYYQSKFTDGKVKVTPTGAMVKYKNAAGEDVELEGAKITYVIKPSGNNVAEPASTMSGSFTIAAIGQYKIVARFNTGATPNAEFKKNFVSVTSNDDPKAKFEVVDMPTVTVTPTSPTLVGFGTDPSFSYEGGLVWSDGEAGTLTETADYTYIWYSDEACENVTNPTKTGTYYVKASGLESTTHHIDYKPLKVVVTSGDIEAEIANHTAEDGGALIYGQPLPLTLTHTTGLAAADVPAFEETAYRGEVKEGTFYGFTAKNKVTGVETQLTRESHYDRPSRTWYTLDTALPVGTYTVTANIEANGFQVFVDAGEWEVVAKDITNEDTGTEGIYVYGLGNEFTYSKEYAGAAILPTAAELSAGNYGISYRYAKLTFDSEDAEGNLVAGDLEVTPTEGKNNINAGEAWFTISGKGNFTGSKDMKFTITKATVDVKPAAGQTWQFGSTPEEYDLDVAYINNQLKGQDKTIEADPDADPAVEGQTGLNIATEPGFRMLAVKRISSTTVGHRENALQAYKTDKGAENEEFATNYNFTFGDNAYADLDITPGIINLKVKDVTVTYAGKDAEPTITMDKTALVLDDAEGMESTLSDLMKKDGNWQRLITGLEELTWSRADKVLGAPEYEYNADTYTDFYECVIPAGKQLTATNYTVNISDPKGTLTINPAAITLKAKDQGPMAFDAVDTPNGFNGVASDATVEEVIAAGATSTLYDPVEELVAIVKPTPVVLGDNNVISLDKETLNNPNYTITTQTGKLTVTSAPVLALTSVMETITEGEGVDAVTTDGDWDKLIAYEGVPVQKITLKLKAPELNPTKTGYDTWEADEWHAMVLPFDVTVKEIALAFGYGIVNVVDPETTELIDKEKKDVRFKLLNIIETIPANTPFCIKTSDPFDYENDEIELERSGDSYFTVDLDEKKVNNDWTVVGEEAGHGFKFEGIYDVLPITNKTPNLYFLGNSNKWAYVGKAGTTYTMQPYTGYVNLGEGSEAREVTFTFEEEDGSTTAIKAVDFFNGNGSNADIYTVDGMKVNAPVQKGVYIKNGKKVLVK